MEASVGCSGSPTTLQQEVQYYVNDGVYQSFNCLFFDHVKLSGDDVHALHPRAPPPGAPSKVVGTLFGPTCDGLDCIVKRVPLPHLAVGDWLFFVDFGAYTTAAQSSFNGFGTHRQYYVNSSAPTHDKSLLMKELAVPVQLEHVAPTERLCVPALHADQE
jgi:hypothetical protein